MAAQEAQLLRLAAAAGHSGLTFGQTRRGDHYGACSCGWRGTGQAVRRVAEVNAVRHILGEGRRIAALAERHGVTHDRALEIYAAQSHDFVNPRYRSANAG